MSDRLVNTHINSITVYNNNDFSIIFPPPFDNLTYLVNNTTLPQFSFGTKDLAVGNMVSKNPSTKIDRTEIMVVFNLDRYWESMFTLLDWTGQIVPFNDSGVKVVPPKQYADIVVHILDEEEKVIAELTYTRCFPIFISGTTMTHGKAETDGLTIPVLFTFEEFFIEIKAKRRHYFDD